MNIASQNGLFGEIAVSVAEKRETAIAERRRKAKQAYDSTSGVWKRATKCFALEEFLPSHETFLFEELTTAYNDAAKNRGLPATVNGKAFAGLQRILIREGKIELVNGVTRPRSNGQIGPVYRSKLYVNSGA